VKTLLPVERKQLSLWRFTRFSVTFQEFSAFLYIKAVWGIERKWGYDLETVLIFTNIKVVGNDEAITDETA